MNKRIQELAKQAGGHFSTRILASNPVQYRESIELWNEHIEKFAQLIVQECVSCIDDGRGEASSMAEHGWLQVCQKEIKEHFGVER